MLGVSRIQDTLHREREPALDFNLLRASSMVAISHSGSAVRLEVGLIPHPLLSTQHSFQPAKTAQFSTGLDRGGRRVISRDRPLSTAIAVPR